MCQFSARSQQARLAPSEDSILRLSTQISLWPRPPLALWEMCLSSPLGLYPEKVRGWSGHFQSHFLSTWEQAAPGPWSPVPGALPHPCLAGRCLGHSATSSHDQGLAALQHLFLPSAEGLSSVHLSASHAWSRPIWSTPRLGNGGKQRGPGETGGPQDTRAPFPFRGGTGTCSALSVSGFTHPPTSHLLYKTSPHFLVLSLSPKQGNDGPSHLPGPERTKRNRIRGSEN